MNTINNPYEGEQCSWCGRFITSFIRSFNGEFHKHYKQVEAGTDRTLLRAVYSNIDTVDYTDRCDFCGKVLMKSAGNR